MRFITTLIFRTDKWMLKMWTTHQLTKIIIQSAPVENLVSEE